MGDIFRQTPRTTTSARPVTSHHTRHPLSQSPRPPPLGRYGAPCRQKRRTPSPSTDLRTRRSSQLLSVPRGPSFCGLDQMHCAVAAPLVGRTIETARAVGQAPRVIALTLRGRSVTRKIPQVSKDDGAIINVRNTRSSPLWAERSSPFCASGQSRACPSSSTPGLEVRRPPLCCQHRLARA